MTASNSPEEKVKRIAVLGSTGSIGTQTLDIVRRFPERFKVTALTACTNWELLASQALEFRPELAVISHAEYFSRLEMALKGSGIEVAVGEQALSLAATLPSTDIVVGALVGYSGFRPTIAALNEGKQVALANKETLVVAGEIINRIVKEKGHPILPVDSEHSAIFQCLRGEATKSMRKIILTASGGPFRTLSREKLGHVTVAQALSHPNWSMGAKVTIDSATMMNKGFEMMEARWLFDCRPERIDVVVHPQSVVHSMVEFCDGSVKAQLAVPDMHLPIGYALAYPDRLDLGDSPAPDFTSIGTLTFESPDFERFPLLRLAYDAAEAGGTAPTVLNAANEVAVQAFLDGKIKFTDISRLVADTMQKVPLSDPVTLESIEHTHGEATRMAKELLSTL